MARSRLISIRNTCSERRFSFTTFGLLDNTFPSKDTNLLAFLTDYMP